jgi:hypothetical protein
MIVQRGEISSNKDSNHNKEDIINVTKAVVRKSILIHNKSQSGKWIPLDKDSGLPHQCQQQY